MGKKRKTYKEKLISDLRRKAYSLEGINSHSSEPEKASPAFVLQSEVEGSLTSRYGQNQADLPQSLHPYILKDIVKTGIITASIIAIQLLLFLILKNNILTLPGVSY